MSRTTYYFRHIITAEKRISGDVKLILRTRVPSVHVVFSLLIPFNFLFFPQASSLKSGAFAIAMSFTRAQGIAKPTPATKLILLEAVYSIYEACLIAAATSLFFLAPRKGRILGSRGNPELNGALPARFYSSISANMNWTSFSSQPKVAEYNKTLAIPLRIFFKCTFLQLSGRPIFLSENPPPWRPAFLYFSPLLKLCWTAMVRSRTHGQIPADFTLQGRCQNWRGEPKAAFWQSVTVLARWYDVGLLAHCILALNVK